MEVVEEGKREREEEKEEEVEQTEEKEEQEEDAMVVEKEAAVMESLPVEVDTDKARGEREKAPDNAEERVVHEAPPGLGFDGEKPAAAAAADGEESGEDGAGEASRNGTESQHAQEDGEGEGEGEGEKESQQAQGEGEGERKAEGEGERQAQEDVEGARDAAVAGNEVEMVDAAAAAEVDMVDAAAAAAAAAEVDMVDVAAAAPVENGDGVAEEGRLTEAKPAGVETNGSARRSIKRKGSAGLEDGDGTPGEVVVKKPKKKINVWSKSTTRKTSRKSKPVKIPSGEKKEECVEVNPTQRFQLEDRSGIQLSKDQKAEKVELSADKMQASSEKGYRMVRATRGITEGAWYFEILVKDLGKTGHTRLGWSTWKGDLQAPVGFDANSYAFRDVDGSKVHQAIREPFSSAYVEGDVIGFYISLPNGDQYAPKYDLYVNKTTRTVYPVPVEKEEGPLKHVPGSEISFFTNGVCQGVAFSDIFAGEYFPAASMYTLPSPEKKCSVRFNFGPNFQFPITDWGGRPVPLPMSQAPPPEGWAADIETVPPPADGNKEAAAKKPETTAANNGPGGKHRMAAERGNGNGSVEGRIPVGVATGGVRTKRASIDEKEKGKRPALAAKKSLAAAPKVSKRTSLPPRPTAAKSPMSEPSLQIEVNLEGCSNDGSEVGPSHAVHVQPFHEAAEPGPGNSSDTETD